MIDYKQLDLIYELTEKYEKLSNQHAWVNMKLGVHPSSCEFKLTIYESDDSQDIYVYDSIDDLLEKLKELCSGLDGKPKFKIGETIWFKDCEGKISSFKVNAIKEKDSSSHIYFNVRGDYVTDDDNIFKSKNELIDFDIKQLEALKDSVS